MSDPRRLRVVGASTPRQVLAERQAALRMDPGLDRPERLPDMAKMAALSESELRFLVRRFGIDESEAELLARSAERAVSRLLATRNPDPELVAKVQETAETAIIRQLQLSGKAMVRDFQERMMDIHGGTQMRWIAVLDDRMCPSCEMRHGEVATRDEWDERGEPGSPDLLCDGNCRCQLVPERVFER